MTARIGISIGLFLLVSSLPIARADARGDALMQKVMATYKAAKTFSATVTSYTQQGTKSDIYVLTLELKKPFLARVVLNPARRSSSTTPSDRSESSTIFDGKYLWNYDKASNQYTKSAFDPHSNSLIGVVLGPMAGFFFFGDAFSCNPDDWFAQGTEKLGGKVFRTSRYVGSKQVDGVTYQVVQLKIDARAAPGSGGDSFSSTSDLYIGTDKLVHRMVTIIPGSHRQPTTQLKEIITNVQMDKPLPAKDFIFNPPPGATVKTKTDRH